MIKFSATCYKENLLWLEFQEPLQFLLMIYDHASFSKEIAVFAQNGKNAKTLGQLNLTQSHVFHHPTYSKHFSNL